MNKGSAPCPFPELNMVRIAKAGRLSFGFVTDFALTVTPVGAARAGTHDLKPPESVGEGLSKPSEKGAASAQS